MKVGDMQQRCSEEQRSRWAETVSKAFRKEKLGNYTRLHLTSMATPSSIEDTSSGNHSVAKPAWHRLLAITSWRDEKTSSMMPPSSPWTDYLELKIPQYSKQLLPLLRSLGFGAPLDLVDVVEVMISTASLLRKSSLLHNETQDDITLNNLFNLLRNEYRITNVCDSQSDAHCQAIFILCGLLSMVYEPSTEGQARVKAPSWLIAHGLIQPEVPIRTILNKPIGLFLRSYGQLLLESRHEIHTKPQSSRLDQVSEQVYASSLSAYSLKHIGKINFEWTDILSNNLTFLPLIRTLLVFQYPSFCAMSIWPVQHSIFDM